jgi:hypothetical protein
MSLRCLFGRHRPSPGSIVRRGDFYVGLCEGCGLTLERSAEGRWTALPPLTSEGSPSGP